MGMEDPISTLISHQFFTVIITLRSNTFTHWDVPERGNVFSENCLLEIESEDHVTKRPFNPVGFCIYLQMEL